MSTNLEIIKKLKGTDVEVELKAILRRLLHHQNEFTNACANDIGSQRYGQLYKTVTESQRQAKILFDTINLVANSKIGYWLDFDNSLCHIVDWTADTKTILTSYDSFDPV